VPPSQEVPDTLRDVVIDGAIRQQPGAVAEVARPAAQNAVQSVSQQPPQFKNVSQSLGRDVFGTKGNYSGRLFVRVLFDIESNGARIPVANQGSA
jgi:hypothetical protein